MSNFGSLITDENLEDLRSTAWYGGINYWARSLDDEEGYLFVLVDHQDGGATTYPLDRERLVKAYAALVDNDQKHVNDTIHGYFLDSYRYRDEDGIDMAQIDATAADVWVQVAAFGEVVYG